MYYPWAVYCEGPPSFIWSGGGRIEEHFPEALAWRISVRRFRSEEFLSAGHFDLGRTLVPCQIQKSWALGIFKGGGGDGERRTKFQWNLKNIIFKFDKSGPLLATTQTSCCIRLVADEVLSVAYSLRSLTLCAFIIPILSIGITLYWQRDSAKQDSAKRVFGETGFGESGFGETGFGETGFAEMGFCETGFSESGFGEIGGHRSGYNPENLYSIILGLKTNISLKTSVVLLYINTWQFYVIDLASIPIWGWRLEIISNKNFWKILFTNLKLRNCSILTKKLLLISSLGFGEQLNQKIYFWKHVRVISQTTFWG